MNKGRTSVTTYVYRILLFGITLSGFAQMPIFKRYYIADIPGLGWLAKFYVTHYMHYLFAIGLVGLVAYLLAMRLLDSRSKSRVTISGYVRAGFFLGLVITGVLLVIRNLPETVFSPVFIITLDIAHLGFCMALLAISLYALAAKKAWLTGNK